MSSSILSRPHRLRRHHTAFLARRGEDQGVHGRERASAIVTLSVMILVTADNIRGGTTAEKLAALPAQPKGAQ